MSSFNALTKSPVQAPAERHRATSASPVLKVHKELALCVHGTRCSRRTIEHH